MNHAALRLYLVADPDHVSGNFLSVIDQALAGGVTMLQMRAKSLSDREHLQLARQLRKRSQHYQVPFVVNDRLDIALASDADGIHLGVDDLPLADVRRLSRPDFIIGYSPETDDQVTQATRNGADYLGVGPLFDTATKSDAGKRLGLHEFSRRCTISPVPVVGIGGITAARASDVLAAGAAGVALVSAILGATDPEAAARALFAQVTMTVR